MCFFTVGSTKECTKNTKFSKFSFFNTFLTLFSNFALTTTEKKVNFHVFCVFSRFQLLYSERFSKFRCLHLCSTYIYLTNFYQKWSVSDFEFDPRSCLTDCRSFGGGPFCFTMCLAVFDDRKI